MDLLEECMRKLRRGALEEADLRHVIDALESQRGAKQDLLYLHTRSSSVTDPVIGISLIRDGKVRELPADPDRWPYQSVLEAINDGWRVISFPDLALLMDEPSPAGLGCQFILERRGQP